MRRVVITGIGTVTSAGRRIDSLWEHVCSGHSCLRPIDPEVFDASIYACQIAGQVRALEEPSLLTKRLKRRTDRSTHLALVAVLDALASARLPVGFLPDVQPERVALMVGTVMGGLSYIENEMHAFWTQGTPAVSPHSETAGFPTGTQGYVSICFGVKGRAFTSVSERVSGAHALIEGAKTIQRGQADIVIAGGTDAPLTPIVWSAYHSSNLLTQAHSEDVSTAYRPFDRNSTGMVIGEGATFLVFEEYSHAMQRGATILGELSGWSMGTYANDHQERGLARLIATCIQHAGISINDIKRVFAHGSGVPEEDAAEAQGLALAFGNVAKDLWITVPKVIFGHVLGAAAPADLAIALQALAYPFIPPAPTLKQPLFDLNFAMGSSPVSVAVTPSLILSAGLGGMYACLLVSPAETIRSPL